MSILPHDIPKPWLATAAPSAFPPSNVSDEGDINVTSEDDIILVQTSQLFHVETYFTRGDGYPRGMKNAILTTATMSFP